MKLEEKYKNQEVTLAVLSKDSEMASLDLYLNCTQQVQLMLVGAPKGTEVSISGYFEPKGDDMDEDMFGGYQDEEDEDDDIEDGDSESDEDLVVKGQAIGKKQETKALGESLKAAIQNKNKNASALARHDESLDEEDSDEDDEALVEDLDEDEDDDSDEEVTKPAVVSAKKSSKKETPKVVEDSDDSDDADDKLVDMESDSDESEGDEIDLESIMKKAKTQAEGSHKQPQSIMKKSTPPPQQQKKGGQAESGEGKKKKNRKRNKKSKWFGLNLSVHHTISQMYR